MSKLFFSALVVCSAMAAPCVEKDWEMVTSATQKFLVPCLDKMNHEHNGQFEDFEFHEGMCAQKVCGEGIEAVAQYLESSMFPKCTVQNDITLEAYVLSGVNEDIDHWNGNCTKLNN